MEGDIVNDTNENEIVYLAKLIIEELAIDVSIAKEDILFE